MGSRATARVQQHDRSVERPAGEPLPTVSVVVPVYNERGNIKPLCDELASVLPRVASAYEILFIDDGSTDGSWELLTQLASRDSHIRFLGFRSNRGKAEALNVGFAEATGRIVITMDGDLQDKPAEIPNLIAALDGVDLVSGWKRVRHDPLGKTIPSKIFNWVTAAVSGVRLHDFNCGLKAYRAEVVKELDLYGEMHRFIPAIAAWRGFKVAEVVVEHAPRVWGKSKYGVSRLFKGAYDLLTVTMLNRFETRPMHFFGSVGLLIGTAGFGVLVYMSYLRLVLDETIGNRPLLFLGIVLLLAGIQLASAGLVGELIVRRTRQRRASPPLREVPKAGRPLQNVL